MNLNLPNQITILRFLLAVLFFVLLSQYSQITPKPWLLDVSAALFVVAAATDFLDGYLARKYKLVTDLGRILDPLVDKVLICGAYIILSGAGFADADGQNVTYVSAWMVVVIVSRELLVTGLRGFNESKGVAFGASMYGKIKMWIQSIAAPVILVLVAHENLMPSAAAADWVKIILMWVTVIATALSTVQYLVRSRYILDGGAAA